MSVTNLPCDACETYTAVYAVLLGSTENANLCENCFTDKEDWIVDFRQL